MRMPLLEEIGNNDSIEEIKKLIDRNELKLEKSIYTSELALGIIEHFGLGDEKVKLEIRKSIVKEKTLIRTQRNFIKED